MKRTGMTIGSVLAMAAIMMGVVAVSPGLAQTVPTVIDCPVDSRENILFSQQTRNLACLI